MKENDEGEEQRDSKSKRAREGGGRVRGRREWMTSSVGMEGYFKLVIGRRPLRTPLR